MSQTWSERLDAAEDGNEFGNVINDLFGWLERKIDESEEG